MMIVERRSGRTDLLERQAREPSHVGCGSVQDGERQTIDLVPSEGFSATGDRLAHAETGSVVGVLNVAANARQAICLVVAVGRDRIRRGLKAHPFETRS